MSNSWTFCQLFRAEYWKYVKIQVIARQQKRYQSLLGFKAPNVDCDSAKRRERTSPHQPHAAWFGGSKQGNLRCSMLFVPFAMIKKRIKNDKTRQGIEANVASLLFDLLLDCIKKRSDIFQQNRNLWKNIKCRHVFGKFSTSGCSPLKRSMSWWSLHHFWKLLVLASWTSQWDSWESILSRLRQKLHLTNHPQHGNLTHYYYHYSPESLSPPRAVQLDDMQQPHCAWCGMWGWAFAEIPAFSIAFAELPRLFQLDQCWFDNPTLLKYLLPMHSESHNRSHMNWDVWNVWNPICMMID